MDTDLAESMINALAIIELMGSLPGQILTAPPEPALSKDDFIIFRLFLIFKIEQLPGLVAL